VIYRIGQVIAWYPGKQEHGKVVPTWNYSVVHAHGTIRFEENRDHALLHVAELTDRQEASRPEPWRTTVRRPGFFDGHPGPVQRYLHVDQRQTGDPRGVREADACQGEVIASQACGGAPGAGSRRDHLVVLRDCPTAAVLRSGASLSA
jgi:hypothetical protein